MKISKFINELNNYDNDALVECTSDGDELHILVQTDHDSLGFLLAAEQTMTVKAVVKLLEQKAEDENGTVKLLTNRPEETRKSADIIKLISVNGNRIFPMADFGDFVEHDEDELNTVSKPVSKTETVVIHENAKSKFILLKDRHGMDLIVNTEHIVSVIYVDENVSEIKLDNGETRLSRAAVQDIYKLIDK